MSVDKHPAHVWIQGDAIHKDRAAGPSLQEKLRAHIRNEAFLATLSRNRRFIVAFRSFHEVHLYEPDVVTDAIREVVTAARTGRRLSGH